MALWFWGLQLAWYTAAGSLLMPPALSFRREVIDPDPPGSELDITLVGDLTGNGRPDVVIGGKRGEANLFWYENPGWRRHIIAVAPGLEAGGVLVDLTGDGRLDIVAGQQYNGTDLYWFEHPSDPRAPWTRRLITDRFRKYHDQGVGDVDGDGHSELVFLSQQAGVLAYADVPPDPRSEPWPDECIHVLADDLPNVEGLAIVDLDGDGTNEILAGTSIFRPGATGGRWRRERYLDGWTMTRVVAADLDGDGRVEIILAEGESEPGRLAVCRAPYHEPEVLRADLFHPHSLAVADFDGDGRLDIFVGEMGLGKNPDPRLLLFLQRPDGRFEELLIDRGHPTHEAKVADLNGDGRPDIVGKPYHPERRVEVWWNEG